MAEAESYSNEKLAELERTLGAMEDEKDAISATLERFQTDVNAVNEQCKATSNELENSRNELKGLVRTCNGQMTYGVFSVCSTVVNFVL